MLIPGKMNYFTSHGLNLGCRKLKFRPMNIVNSTKYNNFKFPKLQLKVSWYLYNYESSNRTFFLIPFVFFKAELLPLPPKISFKTVFLNKRRKISIMKLFALSLFFWLNHKVHYLLQMTIRAFYHILSYLWNPGPIL